MTAPHVDVRVATPVVDAAEWRRKWDAVAPIKPYDELPKSTQSILPRNVYEIHVEFARGLIDAFFESGGASVALLERVRVWYRCAEGFERGQSNSELPSRWDPLLDEWARALGEFQ
jgi:hypothetical protein